MLRERISEQQKRTAIIFKIIL